MMRQSRARQAESSRVEATKSFQYVDGGGFYMKMLLNRADLDLDLGDFDDDFELEFGVETTQST